jgi:hypothetical protein
MGMDLGRGLSLNWHAWRYCLETAKTFGWVPQGTELRHCPYGREITEAEKQEWSGTYFSNDWQWVTDEDAREMAKALRRAIARMENDEDFEVLADRDVLVRLMNHASMGGFSIG